MSYRVAFVRYVIVSDEGVQRSHVQRTYANTWTYPKVGTHERVVRVIKYDSALRVVSDFAPTAPAVNA